MGVWGVGAGVFAGTADTFEGVVAEGSTAAASIGERAGAVDGAFRSEFGTFLFLGEGALSLRELLGRGGGSL